MACLRRQLFCGLSANNGGNVSAEEFDAAQEVRLGQLRDVHLECETGDATQGFTVAQKFFRYFLRVAHQK